MKKRRKEWKMFRTIIEYKNIWTEHWSRNQMSCPLTYMRWPSCNSSIKSQLSKQLDTFSTVCISTWPTSTVCSIVLFPFIGRVEQPKPPKIKLTHGNLITLRSQTNLTIKTVFLFDSKKTYKTEDPDKLC